MLLSRASSRRLRCYRARGAPEGWTGVDAEALAGPARHRRRRRERGLGRSRRGRMAWVGQGIDALELLLNRPRQGKGIQAGTLPPQGRGHGLGDLRAREDAVQRGLWGVIAAADAPTNPLLA